MFNLETDHSKLTLPNGLLGVLMTIAFVREFKLLASSSGHKTQSALDKPGPVGFLWSVVIRRFLPLDLDLVPMIFMLLIMDQVLVWVEVLIVLSLKKG